MITFAPPSQAEGPVLGIGDVLNLLTELRRFHQNCIPDDGREVSEDTHAFLNEWNNLSTLPFNAIDYPALAAKMGPSLLRMGKLLHRYTYGGSYDELNPGHSREFGNGTRSRNFRGRRNHELRDPENCGPPVVDRILAEKQWDRVPGFDPSVWRQRNSLVTQARSLLQPSLIVTATTAAAVAALSSLALRQPSALLSQASSPIIMPRLTDQIVPDAEIRRDPPEVFLALCSAITSNGRCEPELDINWQKLYVLYASRAINDFSEVVTKEIEFREKILQGYRPTLAQLLEMYARRDVLGQIKICDGNIESCLPPEKGFHYQKAAQILQCLDNDAEGCRELPEGFGKLSRGYVDKAIKRQFGIRPFPSRLPPKWS